mmetsp:Transcript_30050/g.69445  ORF Transcript_30050/g.69445 Transcript_30050/m.69445 type:complete len:211 (+) Transcript_30050:69-701(+)
MSANYAEDELPECVCGETMTIVEDATKMWKCCVCEEFKSPCSLQYTCTCGRQACDECVWEQQYGEWDDEYCELGAYDGWNGCDAYEMDEERVELRPQWGQEEHGDWHAEHVSWEEHVDGEEYAEWYDTYGYMDIEYCCVGPLQMEDPAIKEAVLHVSDWCELEHMHGASAGPDVHPETSDPLPALLLTDAEAKQATQELKGMLHLSRSNS